MTKKKNIFEFFRENLNTWCKTSWANLSTKLVAAYLLKLCVTNRGYQTKESWESLSKDRIIWGFVHKPTDLMLSFHEIWMWNMNNSYKAKKLQKQSV